MLKGWRCPSHGEKPGRNNSFDYCINKCTMPCVAPPVLEAMRKTEDENPHTDKVISVTMLTGGCKRQTVLERNKGYYLEPSDMLPQFRGTMVHTVVDKASKKLKKKGWLIEEHMTMPIKTSSGEWTLSGTLDAYDPIRATLFDVKTLQAYAVEKLVTGQNKGEYSNHIPEAYVKQANLYAYMGRKLGLFDAKRLRLQLIDFGQLILTGSNQIEVALKKGFRTETNLYDIPDIPVLEDWIIESWIEIEGDAWYRVLNGIDEPDVRPDDMAWLCKRCVFMGTEYCPDPKIEAKARKERLNAEAQEDPQSSS